MRKFLRAVAAALLLLGPGVAYSATADPAVAQVTKANDDMQLATKNYDTKAIDKILTDDFILVQNKGTIVKRAAFLADIGDRSGRWIENRSSDLSVRHYGNTALVVGILHMRYEYHSKINDVKLRFTDVWVKQNGQWKWALSQVAHMPPH